MIRKLIVLLYADILNVDTRIEKLAGMAKELVPGIDQLNFTVKAKKGKKKVGT